MTKRPPGRCIFCENMGVTKEHLFSDWLRQFFQRSNDDTHIFGKIHWKPAPLLNIKEKQGHSGSRFVRKVCRKCNSEWISQIDSNAKKIAPELIQGRDILVTPEMQQRLALWLAKIAIVGDSSYAGKGVVQQVHRTNFMQSKKIPSWWRVYIASYAGIRWRELGIKQDFVVLDVPTPFGKVTGYVEVTIMGFRNLFAVVLSSELRNTNF